VTSGIIDLRRVRAALADRSAVKLTHSRRAAVALVLSAPGGVLSTLLVQRAERQGDPWSGHMAFPGGHEEAGDGDLLHTARREAHEEVGLDLTRAELLGLLDDVSPLRSSSLLVRPFVFWTPEVPPIVRSAEVAETLWVPLSELASGSLRTTREVVLDRTKLRVPAFALGDRVVWGMTFRLLERFLAQIEQAP
jgi:8-oxo-dGTP pyrophosphatase MutT (NUDIX family)